MVRNLPVSVSVCVLYLACEEGYYKDTVANASCLACPQYSVSSGLGSTHLSECECIFSPGNAQDTCYGKQKQPLNYVVQ